MLAVSGALAESPSPVAAASSPIALFNGRNLDGWRPPTGAWQVVKAVALDAADPTKLVTTAGTGVAWTATPRGPAPNLVTEGEYGDVELHVEFWSRAARTPAST